MTTAAPTQAPDDARDRLIEAHLHLVDSIARKYRCYGRGGGVEFDDLVAYGREGLLGAATRFDATKGVPFEAFARRRIEGAIIDGIRRGGWFGRRAYRRPRAGLGGIVERAANHPESAVVLPAGLVILHAEHAAGAVGQDLFGMGDGGEAGDGARWNGGRMVQVSVEHDDAFDALLQSLAANLSLLPARQRRLLDLCCCQDEPLNQAARELDLHVSWASRLRAEALATLRAALKPKAQLLGRWARHQQRSGLVPDEHEVEHRRSDSGSRRSKTQARRRAR